MSGLEEEEDSDEEEDTCEELLSEEEASDEEEVSEEDEESATEEERGEEKSGVLLQPVREKKVAKATMGISLFVFMSYHLAKSLLTFTQKSEMGMTGKI